MARYPTLVLPLLLATTAFAQHGQQQSDDPNEPMYVAPASDEARQQIQSFQLAAGLTAELVAAEPDLCNGVAFAIDDHGNFYVGETFRVGDGVFDDRNFLQWLDEDLAATSVADRIRYYEKHLPDRLERLRAFTERIRMLADTDGDGAIDRVTVFAEGFRALEDGLVAGVLPLGDEVLTTIIPKVWRLRDRDGDGVADERRVMFDGFGVHTSLMGHDLHGLTVGPDRRLYFSVGDRGFRVEHAGETLSFPHEGAVLRCELDGSDLEVVHRGLRNPQELAFDRWGDLITADNNSDGGDRARLVQVLPGADSGWRIGYQWLSDRGAWNREKMWRPRHPRQTAQIVPPIQNFADGPSGLCFDPGIGLPERFRDCFFLCDFRGSASYSGVRTFRLSRAGAGYEVENHDRILWNALVSDCAFGPDGALYVLDWVHGWTKTGKGRIYRLRTPAMANDFKLRGTARLLARDMRTMAKTQLLPLLSHPDRRVRQKAQFALVDQRAIDALEAASNDLDSRMARLHGVFGLGDLARHGHYEATRLLPLCDADDADVRAMAARALGDARCNDAEGRLRKLLADDNSRVRREAAFALARLGEAASRSLDALLALLRHNDDRDAVLRHAAVTALAACVPSAQLDGRGDDTLAVQRGVLLALAKQASPLVAGYLDHPDEQLRFEAARAIYETPIPAAMQALALKVYDDAPDSERFDWRAINAARMLGEVEHGEALVHLATLATHPPATRLEALAVLAEWRQPDGQCRVTGLWRPCKHPDAAIVAQNFRGSAKKLFADRAVCAEAARAAAGLGLAELGPELQKLVADGEAPTQARVAALDALAELRAPALTAALDGIAATAPVPLRKRAVALLSRTAPEKAVPVLASLLANASITERQAACEALGELQHPKATAVLRDWLARISNGDAPAAIHLDVLEAAARHDALRPVTDAYYRELAGEPPLVSFAMCLQGGEPREGRKVFFDFQASSCTRCHTLGGRGGNAGPVLDGIGARLAPEQILEALVAPSARIADGFQTTTIELHDGMIYSGVVTGDDGGMVTIVGLDGKPTDLPNDRIKSRRASTASAMPKMADILSRRQLRDLVAFLRRQRSPRGG
ncbi:MAG TPA: c-type cytochrome [bacterium]|nr:c-type cytochrome [bacterium]